MDDEGIPVPAEVDSAPGFETFLLKLVLRFVDMAGDQVEGGIREAQRELCAALDLDRSSLWQTRPDGTGTLRVTHLFDVSHAALPVEPEDGSRLEGSRRVYGGAAGAVAEELDAAAAFPWLARRVRKGLTSVVSSLEELPPDAAIDASSLQSIGTASTVVVPLRAGPTQLGCMTFASTGRRRQWTPDLVVRLELVADVFARILARKRAALTLRERSAWLELAAVSAGAGLWEVEVATGRIRATAEAKRLYGFPPEDDDLDVERVLAVVHPDDRQGLRDRPEWGRTNEPGYSREYRVLLPDGSIRWINSRGRTFETVPGRPPDRVLGASIDVTERRRVDEELRVALDEAHRLRDRLQHENVYLREEIRERRNPSQIVGTSAAIGRILDLVEQVAPTGATVLLLGETGTGKERVAAAIHELSPRRSRPMVKVNCAAMPSTLIESELFGREKGAYTGALTRQIGRFELAHGSTIFLDEIGDLPVETQTKLLRVIETREFERLGSPNPVHVDVRIIAATNRDLDEAVRSGAFREDLYFRLNVFPISLPPLRDRSEDIPLLVKAIVDDFSASVGRRFESISRAGMMALQQYSWPGNIRELRNIIERAMISADGPVLEIEPPASSRRSASWRPRSLRELERAHVLAVLEETSWRIRGPLGAAVILGLPPTTLENRMARLGIVRPGKKLPQQVDLPNTGGRSAS